MAVKPNELVRDVVDTVLDVVGLVPSVVRGAKEEAKQLNGEISNAASGRGSMPDPVTAVMRVGKAALNPVQSAVNDVSSRINRLGR